jgi:hypothetical protein
MKFMMTVLVNNLVDEEEKNSFLSKYSSQRGEGDSEELKDRCPSHLDEKAWPKHIRK